MTDSAQSKLFVPSASAWLVGAIFLFAAILFVVLIATGQRNPAMRARDTASGASYGDFVTVEPGARYFFTWGVTAFPRTREIARGDEDARYGDTYAQARAVLAQLRDDLDAAGLALRDVVKVRAYLTAPEGGTHDFAGWDRAFREYFGTWHNAHRPARTTLGISRLFNPEYRIEVEFTVVFPPGRGPLLARNWHDQWQARLARVETSDTWRSYGRPSWVMSTGKAVDSSQGLFISSGFTPADTSDPAMRERALAMIERNPAMAERMASMLEKDFGSVREQAGSLFEQSNTALEAAGLTAADVFFMRMIVFPSEEVSIGQSFGAFNGVYERFYNSEDNPNRPTRTLMSAPGFAHEGQYLAKELYAVYPAPAEGTETQTDDGGSDAPLPEASGDSLATQDEEGSGLRAIGHRPGLQIAGDLGPMGVRVPGDASLVWFAGTIATPGEAFESYEARIADAWANLGERMDRAGVSAQDLVHLRAYIVKPPLLDEDGKPDPEASAEALDARVAAWEQFYKDTFAAEDGAGAGHLPALTTMAVEALPLGGQIEIEALGAKATD